MSKIGLIIGREYSSRVRKRSFIIMTFLGPVLFAAVIIGAVMAVTNDTTFHQVVVVDETGLAETYREQGRLFQDSDQLRYSFASEMQDSTFASSPYTLWLEMTPVALKTPDVAVYYKGYPSQNVQDKIRNDVEGVLERNRLEKHDISYEDYQAVKVRASVRLIDIEDDTKSDSNLGARAMVGIFFAVLIYMFIFIYGVQVMRGVIEEKTNRIVEVLVSSVKPFQLMMGKIVGIGLVGLTQFLMWVILSSIVMAVAQGILIDQVSAGAMTDGNLPAGTADMAAMMDQYPLLAGILSIPWGQFLGTFVFYFLGGFLLYGSIFAAIGAAVDSETDTQQFMLPVTVPLIFSYIIAIAMIANPEGSAGTVFSIVPLTSPIVMMVRMGIGLEGSYWQLGLSMALLAATFVAVVWLAGRIYRTGILMYGKKATYKELWKWLFYKG
ncbi:MAG: ABC transporter permease [Flavobacteriales bacterium]